MPLPILARSNPTFHNPSWESAEVHVLIVRLSRFRDVARSTPHLFLAAEARRGAPASFVDFAFLPEVEERKERRRANQPLLFGVQSGRPVVDFDLTLVSNSCVPEVVNFPVLLLQSGIPLWASQRDGSWPAIILGGSNATAAHSLVGPGGDCMADAIFFGEGEEAVARLVSRWKDLSNLPKRERIAAIAGECDGLWPAGDGSWRVTRAIAPPGVATKLGTRSLPAKTRQRPGSR